MSVLIPHSCHGPTTYYGNPGQISPVFACVGANGKAGEQDHVHAGYVPCEEMLKRGCRGERCIEEFAG
eukprot:193330-Amorphochlora_amoeboformis.AAC.1